VGWTINDPDWQQEVAAEKALVRRALVADMPILAICCGAHIVASVLGANISPCDHPEVGWCMVESRDDDLCPPGEWFLFHENGWSPVAGAVPLGWSDPAPQAVRFGRTLGVQFHPEATLTMIERWLELAPVRVAASGVDPAMVLEDSIRLGQGPRERGRALVRRFVAEFVDGTAIAGELPPTVR